MKPKKESGYVIISVAVLLVVFLGFAALAVDSGFLYDSRTSGQRVADAAALAGVFTFVTQPQAAQPATAINHAQSVATDQTILQDGVAVGDVNVTVDVPGRMVTVDLTYTENTFFSQVLGFNAVDIAVQAIAEAGTNSTGTTCAKPWFIPNTILSALEPCEACGAMPPEVIVDSGGMVTPYATMNLGQEFRIKPGNPADTLGPGVFSAIQMPGSQGGNDYRNNITGCADVPVECQDSYSVETGNMIGPTEQGVEALIGEPPDDTWIAVGAYMHPDGNTYDTSKALVVAPVWDVCGFAGFCPDQDFPQGTNTSITVAGFALMFVDRMQDDDVMVRLVNVTACPAGSGSGGSGGGGEAAPYSIPVRLIRTQ